jgi:predicted nucleic acid-binding protein
MYLLDTNVISELRVPKRTDPQLLAWTEHQDETSFFLSVMTVLEIQYGALLLARRDAKAGKVFRRWVEESVLAKFADRILPATVDIALACARLHIPDRRGERDAWIAATALAHNLTVVTRNVRDFSGTGVKLVNPWLRASG